MIVSEIQAQAKDARLICAEHHQAVDGESP